MARAKTGDFWLTDSVELPAASADGTRVQGSISLGSLVDVGDMQALEILETDFIWQGASTHTSNVEAFLAANGTLSEQLSDQNPNGEFVRADDTSLISSGALNIDIANNQSSHAVDLYPDSFKGANGRFVVNDELFFVIGVDGAAVSGAALNCVVRIRARIVTMTAKDWIAQAVTAVAND